MYRHLLIEVFTPQMKIISVTEWPQGKTDPTEYDSTRKVILIRADYDWKNDPAGWVEHEKEHQRLDLSGVKDDGKEYPYNNIEAFAYMKQFKYLKQKGIKSWLPLMPHKKQHERILQQYWDKA